MCELYIEQVGIRYLRKEKPNVNVYMYIVRQKDVCHYCHLALHEFQYKQTHLKHIQHSLQINIFSHITEENP